AEGPLRPGGVGGTWGESFDDEAHQWPAYEDRGDRSEGETGVDEQAPGVEILGFTGPPRPQRSDEDAPEAADGLGERGAGDEAQHHRDERKPDRAADRPREIAGEDEDDDEHDSGGDGFHQAPDSAHGLPQVEVLGVQLRDRSAGTVIHQPTSVISAPRPESRSRVGRAGALYSPGLPGRCRCNSSRGGRGPSPRTTTTSCRISSTSPAAPSSIAALPEMTARRNQRGPSTPRNRTGRSPARPSLVRTARRARSSRPKPPSLSSTDPPCLPIDSVISSRSSSQIPWLRGAAKA